MSDLITLANSITFPKINKKSSSIYTSIKPNLSYQDSPFRFPSDEEIFITNKMKNKILSESKKTLKNLRIWEKKTASTKNSLNRIKIENCDSEIQGETPLKITQSQNLIKKEALQIIKSRIPLSIQSSVQNKYNFINQKKTIFLIDLETSNIQDEILKLRTKSDRKETSLEKSMELLDLHKEKCNKQIENDFKLLNSKNDKLNQLLIKKSQIETEHKKSSMEVTSLKNDVAIMDSTLKTYNEYKDFFDNMAPLEWYSNEEKRTKNLIEEQKNIFIKNKGNSVKKFENNISNLETNKGYIKGGIKNNNCDDLEQPSNEEASTTLFFKFQELLEKGRIVDDKNKVLNPYNRGIYFTNPEELYSSFMDKEEKNLFLVQQIQVKEEEVENNKNIFLFEKTKLDKMYNDLVAERDKIILEIAKEKNIIPREKNLKFKKNQENEIQTLNNLKRQLLRLHKKIETKNDMRGKSSIDIMRNIEIKIENLIQKISECDPKIVTQIEKRLYLENMNHEKQIKNEEIQKLQNAKQETARERLNRKLFKVKSKPLMYKLAAPVEKKKIIVNVKKDDQNDFQRYFGDD